MQMAALKMLSEEQASGKKSFKNLVRVKVISQGLGADPLPGSENDGLAEAAVPAPTAALGKAVLLPPMPVGPSEPLPAQLDLKTLSGWVNRQKKIIRVH